MNDLKFHVPVRYEIKILSTTEMKFYAKWYYFKVTVRSKIAYK